MAICSFKTRWRELEHGKMDHSIFIREIGYKIYSDFVIINVPISSNHDNGQQHILSVLWFLFLLCFAEQLEILARGGKMENFPQPPQK